MTEGATPGEGRLRTAVAAVFYFGTVGTLAELIFLEHYDERLQYAPFVALVAASVVFAWALARPRAVSVRATRWAMAGLALVGLIGIIVHYRSNVLFELEMDPGMRGLALVWPALRGATPSLAPGQLAQLGLIGFLFTIGHPALRGANNRSKP